MTKKLVNIANKVDLELDSNDPDYFANGNKYQVAIINKKKHRRTEVLSDASIQSIMYMLLLIKNTKKQQRNRLLKKRGRPIK